MGLNSNWRIEFLEVLNRLDMPFYVKRIAGENFIFLKDKPVAFNFLDISATPDKILAVQKSIAQQGLQLINIWEDQWTCHNSRVLNRLNSLAGINERIHARACILEPVTQKEAGIFLEAHHLQGSVKAKYRLALKKNTEIVAVATFNSRPMPHKGEGHISAELIRFCSLSGFTVVGGISKLITGFIEQYRPGDIMTYADKDWSDGSGYLKLGFKLVGETPPITFWLSPDDCKRYPVHRLPKTIQLAFKAQTDLSMEEFLMKSGFIRVFNTGNRKFIRILKDET